MHPVEAVQTMARIAEQAEKDKSPLNDIGTIILNEDGNYTFEPCEAGILTLTYM